MNLKLGLFLSTLLAHSTSFAFTTTFFTSKFINKNEALNAAYELKSGFQKSEEYHGWIQTQCKNPEDAYTYNSFLKVVTREHYKEKFYIGQVTVEVRCS